MFGACYDGVESGIVFEKNPQKTKLLGLQRPTWRVYEADCEVAINAGVGNDLPVNLLDVDPYGDPWPVIEAFFSGSLGTDGFIMPGCRHRHGRRKIYRSGNRRRAGGENWRRNDGENWRQNDGKNWRRDGGEGRRRTGGRRNEE